VIDVRSTILGLIREIAPEADLEHLDGAAALRDELDLDSMDALNLLTAIAGTLGVEVPERDEGQTRTLDSLVAYVTAHLPAT